VRTEDCAVNDDDRFYQSWRSRDFPDPRLDISTDPAVVKVLRESLERDAVRDGDPVRAELAREILAGRMRASDVLSYSVYAEVVADGVTEYIGWVDGLSEAERAEHEGAAAEHVAGLRRDELAGPSPSPSPDSRS
jgi:hypothetical protein